MRLRDPQELPGWIQFALALAIGAAGWLLADLIGLTADWAALLVGAIIGVVFGAWAIAAGTDKDPSDVRTAGAFVLVVVALGACT